MKSIRSKIILLVVILLMVTSSLFSIMSVFLMTNYIKDSVGDEMKSLALQGAVTVEEHIGGKLLALETLALNEKIADTKTTHEQKAKLLQEYAKKVGAVDLAYSDLSGKLILSADESEADISKRDYFNKAINGESTVSDPLKLANKNMMVTVYAVPIYIQGKVQGILVEIRRAEELSDITDSVRFAETGTAYIINKNYTFIANHNRDMVLNMDNAVKHYETDPKFKSMAELQIKAVQGDNDNGGYEYMGVKKVVGYAPISLTGWTLVVTAEESDVYSGIEMLNYNVSILVPLTEIIGIVVAIIFAIRLIKPLKTLKLKLNGIAEGDFTNEIPANVLKLKDETGALANGIKTMEDSIGKVISIVKSEVNQLDSNVETQKVNISKLLDELESISATTEQLSASAQQTAASTEQINASSDEIDESLNSISVRAEKGSQTAAEISHRAQELKKGAIKSKETTLGIYEKSEKMLNEAIENAKKVDQITALSKTILDISEETNLLALNASIEAARAGEAGRGFAVVAGQIGKLADDSQRSVEEIQKVTDSVFDSVDNLAKCATELLEFVSRDVLKDYDTLLKTSEQYDKDSQLVDEIISNFNETTIRLHETVKSMVSSIDEISTASNESAAGTSHIAERTAVIVEEANSILEYTKNTKSSAENLVESISKFKI